MQVLVAGGAGFLGSVVVHELSVAGLRPIILDDFSTGHRQAVRGVDGIEGCLTNEADLRRLLSNFRFDAAVLVAGVPALEAEEPELLADTHERYRRYFGGALELSRVLREYGGCPLILASTLDVYGHSPDGATGPAKTATPRPDDSTGRIALAVENLLLDCQRPGGLRPLILRFGWIAGAQLEAGLGDDRGRPAHWFSRLVRQASARPCEDAPDADASNVPAEGAVSPETRPLESSPQDGDSALAPEEGKDERDSRPGAGAPRTVEILHVTDAARCVVAAVRSAVAGLAGIFDIGGGSPATLESIAETFRELTGCEAPPLEPARTPPLPADARVACEALDWRPEQSDLRRIIDDAVAWRLRYPDGYRSFDVYRAREEASQAELFGEIAMRRGFITASQLIRALELQQSRLEEGQGHELLGLILLREGMLNNIQLLEVLRYYEAERRRASSLEGAFSAESVAGAGASGKKTPEGLARKILQRKRRPRRTSGEEETPDQKRDKDRACD